MYVYKYIYIYIYIYTHTHAHTCIYTCVYIYTYQLIEPGLYSHVRLPSSHQMGGSPAQTIRIPRQDWKNRDDRAAGGLYFCLFYDSRCGAKC